MNKILLIYDDIEIVITTENEIEDVVRFLNINADEQFVLIESVDGKIGLNPRSVTLIKDITNNIEFNPCKKLKCNVNVDIESLAEEVIKRINENGNNKDITLEIDGEEISKLVSNSLNDIFKS